MTGLAEPGNVLNGYITAKSTVQLNRANEQLAHAQAQLTAQQAIDIEQKREQLKEERPATVGILRDMAAAEHQPIFDDLAQWVAAGGDPNYAMNYALTHQAFAAPKDQTTESEPWNAHPASLSHARPTQPEQAEGAL